MDLGIFKPLNTNRYLKSKQTQTNDTLYWKRLSTATLIKEFGAIDYVNFNPVDPNYFAVTSSVRVQIYNPITKFVVKNLSRFQENAYGGNFRADGRLLVAGDEEGYVKLFDTSSKNILRAFTGHVAPVHRAYFTSDSHNICSFSDDKTVKLWDISTEKLIHSYEGHNDYIRAGRTNPTSTSIIASGGYDNIIKLYDIRTNKNIFDLNHDAPVESLLFLPSGGILLSAGGTNIKVWDIISGGKLLTKLSHHHKTITCLELGSNGKRVLSGGLDRHVKIYDVGTYQSVYSLTFPNSVLSLGVSRDDQAVAVGMVDGLLSIHNMEHKKNDENQKISSSYKHIVQTDIDHEICVPARKKIETHYDHWLRKYEYSKALEYVLKRYVVNKNPHVTVSVLQELIKRKGLARALIGNKPETIPSLCKFIINHLSEQRFMRILVDVADIVIKVYEDTLHSMTAEIGKHIIALSHAVQKQLELTNSLSELQGVLETLIVGIHVKYSKDIINFTKDLSKMNPSKQAKQSSIVKA